MDDLRERTNPVFNTAKATLLQLAEAGHADAAMMAEMLGLDLSGMTFDDERKKAMGKSNVATFELRYRSMNAFIEATGAKTIVDLPCGYTPRALEDFVADKRYIACDLPAVAEEMGPLVDKILAQRGLRRDVAYHGVDATNYAALRAALEGAEGPLCITTEGLMMYFTESELAALLDNVRRVLEEFGGVWITQDPEVARVFIAMSAIVMSGDTTAAKAVVAALGGSANMSTVLKAMAGDRAQSALNASKDAYGGAANVNFGNVMTIRGEPERAYAAAKDFLRAHGLKAELTPVARRMPKLSSLDPERTELARQAMENISLWTITPDGAARESGIEAGGVFGVDTAVDGSELAVTLRGRVDSLTAPEFLAAFEKAAAGKSLTAARVDMSRLEYISSAGLRVLLIMTKRLGAGRVTVTGANELVRSIFEQTGYDDILTLQ